MLVVGKPVSEISFYLGATSLFIATISYNGEVRTTFNADPKVMDVNLFAACFTLEAWALAQEAKVDVGAAFEAAKDAAAARFDEGIDEDRFATWKQGLQVRGLQRTVTQEHGIPCYTCNNRPCTCP